MKQSWNCSMSSRTPHIMHINRQPFLMWLFACRLFILFLCCLYLWCKQHLNTVHDHWSRQSCPGAMAMNSPRARCLNIQQNDLSLIPRSTLGTCAAEQRLWCLWLSAPSSKMQPYGVHLVHQYRFKVVPGARIPNKPTLRVKWLPYCIALAYHSSIHGTVQSYITQCYSICQGTCVGILQIPIHVFTCTLLEVLEGLSRYPMWPKWSDVSFKWALTSGLAWVSHALYDKWWGQQHQSVENKVRSHPNYLTTLTLRSTLSMSSWYYWYIWLCSSLSRQDLKYLKATRKSSLASETAVWAMHENLRPSTFMKADILENATGGAVL